MTTKNSDLVANLEASPQVANNVAELHGRKRVAQGTIALATTDLNASDLIMLAPVPSGASITSIMIASDDLDTGTTLSCEVGLYSDAGVVEDADCYASAVTDWRAATAFTEYRFEAANINTCGQKVWQDAGLAADDGAQHYVAITVTAAGNQAGDLSFMIEYVVD